ncbi:MAG TPA: glutamate--tRNA ligase, partial [Aestuariivirga sp.]|nr:glutamate--tRNA ligase [Aestuariivirga sp.]
AHHSLLTGADGKGLSKRLGSLSIASMREAGLEAMAVVSHAALLGTSESIHPCADYRELVESFDLAKLSRAPARFDEAELKHLNARLLHILPHEAVRERLGEASEAFWNTIRGNLETLADTKTWLEIVRNRINPVVAPEDRDFIAQAARLLPPEPWDGSTWKIWTEAIKATTDRKGKALFMPLRLALTGLDHGPELASLLPLIGRQKALDRLS